MLKGIDVSQRIEFVSENDKGEPKTVFVFRPLNGLESIKMGLITSPEEGIFEMLRTCIVEVRNFDGVGTSAEAKDILPKLSPKVLTELINQMNSINEAGEQERKNS